MRFPLLSTLVLSLVLPYLALGDKHGSKLARRHNGVAVRPRGDLQKRTNGQATWFNVGLGACGQWSQPSDFIVALNSDMYGSGYPGPHCFETITITGLGKSTTAVIMDECPTCNYGDLDMSTGLFQFFTNLGVGEFPIVWWYGGSDDKPSPPPPPPPPTSTHHTTHHTSTKPTSTSTSTHDTASSASTTTSSDASNPTGGVTPDDTGETPTADNNLLLFNTILVNLGNMVAIVAGAS